MDNDYSKVGGVASPYVPPATSGAQYQQQFMSNLSSAKKNNSKKWIIVTILLGVVTLGLGILSIWLYQEYSTAKTDVNSQIEEAVAVAVDNQMKESEAACAELLKEPNLEFVGPEDYGLLSFAYPRTWSVYVAKDASSGGDYEAYLHPVVVNMPAQNTPFALRVIIRNKSYESVLKEYENKIKNGDVKSSVFVVDKGDGKTENGTRLDGNIDGKLIGAAVLLKVRDKTVILRTDANTFMTDFNKLIKTIAYNS